MTVIMLIAICNTYSEVVFQCNNAIYVIRIQRWSFSVTNLIDLDYFIIMS